MKPQNYSLKFQNSLADSRITPGSQHGNGVFKSGCKSGTVRNGLRAVRKPTKRELRAKGKMVKKAVDVGGGKEVGVHGEFGGEVGDEWTMGEEGKEVEGMKTFSESVDVREAKEEKVVEDFEVAEEVEEWNGFSD